MTRAMNFRWRAAGGGLLMGVVAMRLLSLSAAAADLDFGGAEFVILSAASGAPIGDVQYTVSPSIAGHQTVTSSARYADGTNDIEHDQFDVSGELPVMVAYEHTFYRWSGALFLVTKADFRSGAATCTTYASGQPNALTQTLEFPSDTYAGAALMLPMRQALRHSTNSSITMHDFVCIPGPRVVKVAAYPQAPDTWDHYPGNLVRTTIKPDFGLLDFVIAPFLPEMYAWFNPANGFAFVGGRFARYYKGPEIILTPKRARPGNVATAN